MDRTVIVFEGLEHKPGAGFLRYQLVGSGTDRFLQKSILADLFVIFSRHDPAGAAEIAGTEQDRKVEKRLGKLEPDRPVIHQLDVLGLPVEQFGRGAAIVFVAPFYIVSFDRRPVVELEASRAGTWRS